MIEAKGIERNMIYSHYVGGWIPRGFVRKFSLGDEVRISDEHFTWSEVDLVYWSDDVDGRGFFLDDLEPYMSYKGYRVDFVIC